MQMQLDKQTGIFSFGKYVISPHTTYTDVLEQYPDIKVVKDEPNVSGQHERIYSFPPMLFNNHYIKLRVVYFTQFISGIYVYRIQYGHSDISKFWTTELVDWTKQAQNWLKEQLGIPHRIELGELYDEHEKLSEEDVAILQSWEYIFDWGWASYYFDSLQQSGEICIHSDYHYQISDWDQLLSQIDYYADHIEQNLRNREPIINAITILQEHFDYLTLRPVVNYNLAGILFNLKQWSHWDNKTWIHLEVNLNSAKGIYQLSRPDSRKKAYTSDLQELVKAVKLFISEDFIT